MCTVTVHRKPATGAEPGVLEVTMNRDEYRRRAPEHPPAITHETVPWVGPRDGERGGTWIGANARGVVACLLNRYDLSHESEESADEGDRPSRGAVIPRALSQGPLPRVLAWLEGELDPGALPPFTLVLASLEETRTFTWNGQRNDLSRPTDAEHLMYTSSSWNPDAVAAWRRHRFQDWIDSGCPTRNGLPTYHLLQPEGREAWSPLLDREDAATRSITQVLCRAGDRHLVMTYRARNSDGSVPDRGVRTVLPLA